MANLIKRIDLSIADLVQAEIGLNLRVKELEEWGKLGLTVWRKGGNEASIAECKNLIDKLKGCPWIDPEEE